MGYDLFKNVLKDKDTLGRISAMCVPLVPVYVGADGTIDGSRPDLRCCCSLAVGVNPCSQFSPHLCCDPPNDHCESAHDS